MGVKMSVDFSKIAAVCRGCLAVGALVTLSGCNPKPEFENSSRVRIIPNHGEIIKRTDGNVMWVCQTKKGATNPCQKKNEPGIPSVLIFNAPYLTDLNSREAIVGLPKEGRVSIVQRKSNTFGREDDIEICLDKIKTTCSKLWSSMSDNWIFKYVAVGEHVWEVPPYKRDPSKEPTPQVIICTISAPNNIDNPCKIAASTGRGSL
jgi:hypothetical protein